MNGRKRQRKDTEEVQSAINPYNESCIHFSRESLSCGNCWVAS